MRRTRSKISDEDQRTLDETVKRIVAKAAGDWGVTAHEIMHPHDFKKAAVARAREQVVPELRATVFYASVLTVQPDKRRTWSRHIKVSEEFRDAEPGNGWYRMSTPMIARALGYRDHTAVVLLLQRVAENDRVAELSAQYVDPVASNV